MDCSLDTSGRERRRRIVYFTLAVVSTLGGVFLALSAVVSALDAGVDASRYGIGQAEVRPLQDWLRAPGTLVPSRILHVAAPSASQVTLVSVEPGQQVRTGDALVTLANPHLVERLSSARAELALARSNQAAGRLARSSHLLDLQASLAATEAEAEAGQLQLAAELELVEAQIISRLHYERTRLNVAYLKRKRAFEAQRLEAARAAGISHEQLEATRMRELQELVTLSEGNLQALDVRAHMDGVVQEVHVMLGQHVAPGAALASIARPDALHAEVRVPEEQARGLATGLSARVMIRDAEVRGRVERVDPAVRMGAVLTRIVMDEALPDFARPDLRVEASIHLEEGEAVLSVPRPPAAVPGQTGQVYLLDQDARTATRTDVHWGRASASRIEVLGGLGPGDRILLLNPAELNSRHEVRIADRIPGPG